MNSDIAPNDAVSLWDLLALRAETTGDAVASSTSTIAA